MLVRWHADPEVARYWDDETFTHGEMLERLARRDVDAHIVEEGGRPVGYLQVWREGDAGGLDMFLVPGARGRGLGPDAARAVATELKRRGWTRVTVDPYTWNAAAVRACAPARQARRRIAHGDHACGVRQWLAAAAHASLPRARASISASRPMNGPASRRTKTRRPASYGVSSIVRSVPK